MEHYYNQIQHRLSTKSHHAPTIIQMWKYYLYFKRVRFIESLEKCEQMLGIIDQMGDIPPETILTLHIMNLSGFL